jgi:hypothetical protein
MITLLITFLNNSSPFSLEDGDSMFLRYIGIGQKSRRPQDHRSGNLRTCSLMILVFWLVTLIFLRIWCLEGICHLHLHVDE